MTNGQLERIKIVILQLNPKIGYIYVHNVNIEGLPKARLSNIPISTCSTLFVDNSDVHAGLRGLQLFHRVLVPSY